MAVPPLAIALIALAGVVFVARPLDAPSEPEPPYPAAVTAEGEPEREVAEPSPVPAPPLPTVAMKRPSPQPNGPPQPAGADDPAISPPVLVPEAPAGWGAAPIVRGGGGGRHDMRTEPTLTSAQAP